MTVRAVVFDIGNVLIQWQPKPFFVRTVGEDRSRMFFDSVPILAMNDRVDAGENLDAAIKEMIALYPDWKTELTMWHDRWIEMATPAIDRSVRLLRALRRAGYPVFALSNFGHETFAIAVREYPFLEEFDRRYISAQLGCIKPDPAIYQRLEDDCGVAPEELLFTDDLPANIAVAQERGWQTHLFDGADGWAGRLVADGLLTQEAAT